MWQTLVGAWPLPLERALQYAEKATREARTRTSWRRPDLGYEAARDRWVTAVYADAELVEELAGLAARLRPHGDRNSLAMLLVKLTAPGVPDFYQGTEGRDDSLVDPDNRRAVDLAARRRALHAISDVTAEQAAHDLELGKLWTIRRVLALRRRSPMLFEGAYRALAASGAHAQRVFAFMRGDSLVTVVPRLGVRADRWRETTLAIPAGRWREQLSGALYAGGPLSVAELWRGFPTALLVREPP